MPDFPLGACFRAPRMDAASCPHQDGWRFSWCVDEPVTRRRAGRAECAVQTVQIVVCMACDTLISEGVIRRAREWHVLGVAEEQAGSSPGSG